MKLQLIHQRSPRIFSVSDFAADSEITHILSVSQRPQKFRKLGILPKKDETGFSFEMPIDQERVLQEWSTRLYTLLQMDNDQHFSWRFRRYGIGEGHRLHHDAYEIEGSTLIVTAILYLTDTELGGETHFPKALPAPVRIQPRKGMMAIWINHTPDGRPDGAAIHESLPVIRGKKATLTNFIYKPVSFAAKAFRAHLIRKRNTIRISQRIPERTASARFLCVNDGVPKETTSLLQKSCRQRNVEYLEVDARLFDYGAGKKARRGDLLYRPAVSAAAMQVERFLYREGVITFHTGPQRITYEFVASQMIHRKAGLRMPAMIYCATNNRSILRKYAKRLGGFPLIAKVPGGEKGVGVIRVDSYPALFSLMDYFREAGMDPWLCEFIRDAEHWRLIVIGDSVVTGYRNRTYPDDFRTYASKDPADYTIPIPAQVSEFAIWAVLSLELEFGGVDILTQPDGGLFLLEVNFPCYFPQAQIVTGIDVSGKMIEYLLLKRKRQGKS